MSFGAKAEVARLRKLLSEEKALRKLAESKLRVTQARLAEVIKDMANLETDLDDAFREE